MPKHYPAPLTLYITTHLEPVLSSGFFTDKATLAASLNASLTPLFFMAEHSRYRNALMCCATCSPCLYSIIGRFGSPVSSSSFASRRSHFRATRTMRTPGQFSSISLFHLVSTFSRDWGESTWTDELACCVAQRERETYREAQHDGMGVVVGERAESVELFLACSIPQTQLDVLSIDVYIMDIIFKHCRFIDGWEISAREDVQERRLSTGSVSEKNDFAGQRTIAADSEAGRHCFG